MDDGTKDLIELQHNQPTRLSAAHNRNLDADINQKIEPNWQSLDAGGNLPAHFDPIERKRVMEAKVKKKHSLSLFYSLA